MSVEEYKTELMQYQEREQWAEAVLTYREIAESLPEDWQNYISMGDALLNLERWTEAAEAYKTALGIKEDFDWGWHNLAVALGALGKWEEASQCHEMLSQIKPSFWNENSHIPLVVGHRLDFIEWQNKKAAEAAILTTHITAVEVSNDRNGAIASDAEALQAEAQRADAEVLLSHTPTSASSSDVRIIAYYLPQFHPIEENNKWWGAGFTEWQNVTRAKPFYPGHLQPRKPTKLGFYDLRVPDTLNAQFDLARKYGVDGFCFYYYWFGDKILLDQPLEMLHSGISDPFPFCLCWVNESWTRSWDGMSGEVLAEVDQSFEATKRFIEDISQYLSNPNYIKLDGKPVISIYCAQKLEDPIATTTYWREFCRSAGIGEIHLCAVQSFGFDDPTSLGFDAAVEFPPHCVRTKHPGIDYTRELSQGELASLKVSPEFEGIIRDYQYFADSAMRRPIEPYPLHQCAMLAWDNTARRMNSAHIYHGFSTETFENWLTAIINKSKQNRKQNKEWMVFINAWNEWAEGCTLEPDNFFGHALLGATCFSKTKAKHTYPLANFSKQFFKDKRDYSLGPQRILLVGHDAHFNGAQINLLSMARTLKEELGHEIAITLLDNEGPLYADYCRVASVSVLSQDFNGDLNRYAAFIRSLYDRGFKIAILNTTATGELDHLMSETGYRVTHLIHELPSLIRSYALEDKLRNLSLHADEVVFSTQYLANQVIEAFDLAPNSYRVLAQGINFNPHIHKRDSMREDVRGQYSIDEDAFVVMGCGYGDFRKGIDIFVQVASKVNALSPNRFVFVWVGEIEPSIKPYIESDAKKLGVESILIVTDRQPDAHRFYLAADLFFLSSREDPLPSVMLEAFDASLPVIAFQEAGGASEVITDKNGKMISYLDESAAVEAIIRIANEIAEGHSEFSFNHFYCRENYDYKVYLNQLINKNALATDDSTIKLKVKETTRISAIVPNYNYKQYLESRLGTIANQRHPVQEIVFLDDCSKDGSCDIARDLLQQYGIEHRVIENETNSGSVNSQWLKGIQAAKSDWVWIAEADDYCEPDFLMELVQLYQKNEEYDPSLCYCESFMVDEKGSVGSTYLDYHKSIPEIYGDIFQNDFILGGTDFISNYLAITNVIPNASACIMRAKSVLSLDWNRILEYRLSADWATYLLLCFYGSVAFSSKPFNYHRRHPKSVIHESFKSIADISNEAKKINSMANEHIKASPGSSTVDTSERFTSWLNRAVENAQ